ncbi:MAG: hypothetical protein MJE77_18890 [Proteobacteria bacterium]|nr:hypothetical protein [Pseudomonadota bacterium]
MKRLQPISNIGPRRAGPLLLSVLMVFALACSGSAKSAKPDKPDKPTKTISAAELAEKIERGRVFNGPDGEHVYVVEFKGGTEALIKVTGTRSDVDGKVLDYKIKQDDRWLRYITQVRGRPRATLVREQRRSGGEPLWRSFLGATYRDGLKVTYDEEASQSLDTVAIYREHEKQKANGSLEALQRFDRPAEEEQEDEELVEAAKSMAETCQVEVPVTIAWDTIDDELLKKLSISGYCGAPLDALRNLCRSEPARAFVKKNVQRVECRFGPEQGLAIEGGTLTWTASRKGVNAQQHARKTLLAHKMNGKTLQYHIKLSETMVCSDKGKKRYIVLAPEGSEKPGLFYGDGAQFTRARTSDMLGKGWFFEPRFFNPRHNSNFRGADLRHWSRVEFDKEAGQCNLSCGTREAKLDLLSGKAAADVASALQVKPDPLPREPYALARDRRGRYYYVDRSTEPGQERFFRLFVGKLGNMKQQRMKDIVSDSEGEIFSSRAGDLRLILDKSKATWITRRRNRPLRLVPVDKNLQMIYNELGVYVGARLGTPCDDYGLE